MDPSTRQVSAGAIIRVPKRAYQACTRCRRRKARCIIEEPADWPNVACMRCRRERKNCVFSTERTRPRVSRSFSQASNHQPPHPDSSQGNQVQPLGSSPFWNEASAVTEPVVPGDNVVHRQHLPAGELHNEQTPESLPDRAARTMVSNQTDALNLLFEAAETYHAKGISGTEPNTGEAHSVGLDLEPYLEHAEINSPGHIGRWTFPTYSLVKCSREAIEVFSQLKFVKKRWITAQEAISYIELFFQNMSPLSPILNEFFRDPSNYRTLVEDEHVLCTVILTLSTRYHILRVDGWLSRSYFIHNRLWRYCQSLLQRVIWGQERGTTKTARGVGAVEGLLLMAEWHARSLHMPPDIEAWDSDSDNPPDPANNAESGIKIPHRWLEGVVEPMRRSDRMSWSLIQSAVSISQELGILDPEANLEAQQVAGSEDSSDWTIHRRSRLRVLIYIYINQLAFRIGFSPLIPQILSTIPSNALETSTSHPNNDWLRAMSLWVDLTRLMRTSSDLLFPSKRGTRDLVRSGRYLGILEHFKTMLESWQHKLSSVTAQEPLKDLLRIDFLYTKTYIYSLSLQAVAERAMSYKTTVEFPAEFLSAIPTSNPRDYEFIQDAMDGSKDVLRMIITMAPSGRLKFLPVRVYVRVISSCIFLLKGLALGVPLDELNSSLDLIDQSARVLRLHVVDDLHLAGVFASLLETYTHGFRERFFVVPKAAATESNIYRSNVLPDALGVNDASNQSTARLDDEFQDWLAHPFDSSIAPFGIGITQPMCGFDDELNFIWNITS